MCCLFGMIDCHGRFSAREKAHILSVLATECEERGTDATGIAYCTHDHLSIYKRPLEAHKLHFRIPEDMIARRRPRVQYAIIRFADLTAERLFRSTV